MIALKRALIQTAGIVPVIGACAIFGPITLAESEIIDTHLHSMSCQPGGLDKASAWMDDNGVSQAIVHPLQASRPKNEAQRKDMLANYKKHQGKIHRFCIIMPDEVNSIAEAVKILEKEKTTGAIGFGDRKYTIEFMNRHSKKLLFGTDCGWWSFKENSKPAPQFELMKSLDLPDEAKANIYCGNAKRLFGFK